MDSFEKLIKNFDETTPDAFYEPATQQLYHEFLEKFPPDSLKNLKLEQYALQAGEEDSRNSFCYWVERGLNQFGSIRGSTAYKFGVYYGSEKSDPVKKWRYASWTDDSYENINAELVSLLDAGAQKNLEAIEANRLSPMFKGKVLALYFPSDYLNIFSYEHIKSFLKKLGVLDYGTIEVAKQRLLDLKKSHPIMRAWSNVKFSNFLYTHIYPGIDTKTPEELNLETPELASKTLSLSARPGSYEAIQQSAASSKKSPTKPDYLKAAAHNQRTGTEGELAVLKYEIAQLEAAGRSDLAAKVCHISASDDTAGYDILSFHPETGAEKHIEVKTTSTDNESVNFYLTNHELQQLQSDPSYCIYYISNIYGATPKITPLEIPQLRAKLDRLAEPVLYRVRFSIKKYAK